MNENYIAHEVRIQLMEELNKRFEKRFDKIDDRMHSQFLWTMGGFLTLLISIIGSKFI